MVILDIADKHHPRQVSTLPVYPPLGSTIAVHSAVPLPGRDVVVINSEALREECDEPAGYAATHQARAPTDQRADHLDRRGRLPRQSWPSNRSDRRLFARSLLIRPSQCG